MRRWKARAATTCFAGVYEEGGTLDEDHLARWAREIDLDLGPLGSDDGLDALEQQTRRAAEEEVCGVPTFMLGPWPFGGIQEEFTMRSILTRWAERQRRPK